MTKEELSKLEAELTCALMHDLTTCETCRKCEGKNFADIRVNLIEKLKTVFDAVKEK